MPVSNADVDSLTNVNSHLTRTTEPTLATSPSEIALPASPLKERLSDLRLFAEAFWCEIQYFSVFSERPVRPNKIKTSSAVWPSIL